MNKIWFLSTCDTCKRILDGLGGRETLEKRGFDFHDLKNNPISKEELEMIQEGSEMSYEELFNKRSRQYSKDMFSKDEEFKQGILEEYTFLKRPIISYGDNVFVGNSKKVVESAKENIL